MSVPPEAEGRQRRVVSQFAFVMFFATLAVPRRTLRLKALILASSGKALNRKVRQERPQRPQSLLKLGHYPRLLLLAPSCRGMLVFAFPHRVRKECPLRAEILKINSENPESSLIRYAADQIRAGEVLGMPTDTFYGLAADPFNLRAVDRVYDIKSRSRHKPLSLLIESIDQAEDLAKPLPEEFYKLARRYWPGPLTIIVKAASRLPLKVTANTGNVALRVPNAKIPLAVVQAANIPITATSANLSGESECTSAEAVRDQLQGRISIIVDGGTSPREVASTIIDLTDEEARWRVLREGAIPSQEISEFFAQG
jgi:L-threonylcarbamoyladenylate synthase